MVTPRKLTKIKAQELVRNQFNESMSHLFPDNEYTSSAHKRPHELLDLNC